MKEDQHPGLNFVEEKSRQLIQEFEEDLEKKFRNVETITLSKVESRLMFVMGLLFGFILGVILGVFI
jgi:tetrahydromethanopterin S-methyltransferase subunit G